MVKRCLMEVSKSLLPLYVEIRCPGIFSTFHPLIVHAIEPSGVVVEERKLFSKKKSFSQGDWATRKNLLRFESRSGLDRAQAVRMMLYPPQLQISVRKKLARGG